MGCKLEPFEGVDIELSMNPLGELFADSRNRLEQLYRGELSIESVQHAEPPRVRDLVDRARETRTDLRQRIEAFTSFGQR